MGPLTLLRELDNGLWATMVILPLEPDKTDVWVDVYTKEGMSSERKDLSRWKEVLEAESVAVLASERNDHALDFAYECGGESTLNCRRFKLTQNRAQD